MENKKLHAATGESTNAAFEKAEATDAALSSADKGVYTHKLSKPVSYEGKTYEELTFDYTKLTGRDAEDIELELRMLGRPVIVAAYDIGYLMRMSAKACTQQIGSDMLEALPISDYNRIKDRARAFLMA